MGATRPRNDSERFFLFFIKPFTRGEKYGKLI